MVRKQTTYPARFILKTTQKLAERLEREAKALGKDGPTPGLPKLKCLEGEK